MSLSEKPLKLNNNMRRKIEDSINKKSPKLNKETRKKTDYLLLYRR